MQSLLKQKGSLLNISGSLQELTGAVGVVYISTYIPRKCGIATFTKDLTNAINLINPLALAKIIALDNCQTERIKYPPEVKIRIRENVFSDYQKAADFINKSKDIDLVCLQHEFGIFGGDFGEMVVEFISEIRKPIVSTLHTVIQNPTEKQEEIIFNICKRSRYIVVMIEKAAEILASRYSIDPAKIVTIHHGVPDFPKFDTEEFKRELRLKDKVVMTSINLLSDWKGIEYAIGAVPKIIEHIPNFIYIVVGETHPTFLRSLKLKYGKDVYREKLYKLVRDLNLRGHVKFVNRYVSLRELIRFMGASDFYITPYSLDSSQATSGSLAYAIGGGRLCISTPYLYAKEMLSNGRGVLVPFRDSKAIADAVIKVYKNPEQKRKMEGKAYELGRTMTWINVGHLYFHLFRMVINEKYIKSS